MEPTSPVLIRLLLTKLARLPDLDFPPIVCLAYEHSDKDQDQQIMATTKITTVTDSPFLSDYLAHIRHLDLDCMSSGDNRASHNIKISPSLRAYIQGSEYKKMCALDQTLEALLDNEGCHNVLVWCLWPVLRREVTWIIARPILEQLRSLAIPVSDITRYFGAIDRLGHLEHVRFLLDELFDYGDEYEADMSDEFVVTTQRRKAESMAAICEFVKEHTRLFKGQLKEVTCTNGLESNFLEQRCSEETLVEIAHLLPTLPRPLYLDRRNWVRFIVKHQKVDLGAVKKVVFPEEQNSWWLRTISKEREFLQRCRSLQKIKMFALGQGSFRWAVQEKRDLDRLRAADTASSASTTCLVLQQEQEQEHRLVPVRSVTIWEDTTMLVDEIDDIAIGFSCTLQRFSINASIHNEPFSIVASSHFVRVLLISASPTLCHNTAVRISTLVGLAIMRIWTL
ncbi:hypothetical protein EC991_003302 [Linnemannia zychae]|nr:hypothetical protein EC991_003302 [Linnemannia zychae]